MNSVCMWLAACRAQSEIGLCRYKAGPFLLFRRHPIGAFLRKPRYEQRQSDQRERHA